METRPAPWDASATVTVWVPPAGVAWGDKLAEFLATPPSTRFDTHLTLRTVDGVMQLHASSCDILFYPQANDRDVVTAMQEVRDAKLCHVYRGALRWRCVVVADWRPVCVVRTNHTATQSRSDVKGAASTYGVSASTYVSFFQFSTFETCARARC